MRDSHPETAAKQQLLQRRAAIARLRSENDASAATLGAERRSEELAENDEIAGVLVLLSERESTELREVDAALKRLDRGSWGRCERCLGLIDRRRLAAIPEARTCASCTSE